MSEPWAPERTVSPELASDLIARQFPGLAPARVEPMGAGWDNTAYLVNETWVFRFPRRAVAVDLLRTEAAILPPLAARLPLAVPEPRYLGEPEERFPWPFAGYRFLAGRTACHADLDDAQRTRAAEPLARFLRALHAVPRDEALWLGAGPDTLGRLDLTKRRRLTRERLDDLHARGLVADVDPLRDLADDVPAGWEPVASALVHGDLYARHLLVDGAGAVTGVIDWGDVHFGDPVVDLALVPGFLPPAAWPAFRAAYGPVGADAWRVARFKALYVAATLVAYGADVGDAVIVREARTALRFLVA